MADVTDMGQPVQIVDQTNAPAGVAGNPIYTTGASNAILTEESAIRAGTAYSLAIPLTTMNRNTVMDLLIQTGSLPIHLRDTSINVNKNAASGTVVYNLYAEPTVSANGTAVTPFNNLRSSTNTFSGSCYLTPTVTTTGTKLLEYLIHSDWETYVAPSYTSKYEIILKTNTKYLLRVNNNMSQSIDLTWFVFFFE